MCFIYEPAVTGSGRSKLGVGDLLLLMLLKFAAAEYAPIPLII
jgi:hypothetical protein